MPLFETRKIRNNKLNKMIAKAENNNRLERALKNIHRGYNNSTKNAVTRRKLFNNNYLKKRRIRQWTALLEKYPNNNYLKMRRNKELTAKLENQDSNNLRKYLWNVYGETGEALQQYLKSKNNKYSRYSQSSNAD